MQLLVGRRVVERLDGLPQPLVLRSVDLLQRGRRRRSSRPAARACPGARSTGRCRARRSAFAAPCACCARECGRACGRAAGRRRATRPPPRRCSTSTSRSRTGPSAPPSHFSSSRTGSAHAGSSNSLPGPEEGPQPPGRDAHLVQLLRVGAEPRTRVVGEHALGLLPDAGAQRRGARGVVGLADRLGLEVEVERLEDLRPAFAVRRSGAAELLLDPPQRLLVAVEQLDLELLEAAGNALVVEDGDRVVDDLGAVGPHALAAGAQARDRQQRRRREGERRAAPACRPAASQARPRPRARAARCPAAASAARAPSRARPGAAA